LSVCWNKPADNPLEFYGYKFTKDGLKPTHEKIKAVKGKSTRIERSSKEFPGNDWVSIEIHTKICITYSTAQEFNTQGHSVQMGT
jgi:hypothetical protein